MTIRRKVISLYGTSVKTRRGDQDRELVELELFLEAGSKAFQPAILSEVGQLFAGHRAVEPDLGHLLKVVNQLVDQDRLLRCSRARPSDREKDRFAASVVKRDNASVMRGFDGKGRLLSHIG